jgi:hypothetical protein
MISGGSARVSSMVLWVMSGLLCGGGCENSAQSGGLQPGQRTAFRVGKVSLQPSFTQIKSAPPDGSHPASIDAYVELKDQYGDPIKALGQFRFELFKYRPAFSDPRGKRFEDEGIQLVDLTDIETNQQHWDSITRSYQMKVKLPSSSAHLKQIVLQVTFITETEYRIRDILVMKR